MKIVLDTSVVIKWHVLEPGHDDAISLLRFDNDFIAPDVIFAELTNVLRKKAKVGQITPEQGRLAIDVSIAALTTVIPSRDLAADANRLAAQLDHAAYDCFFLAAALRYGVLVTADTKFATKCQAAGFSRFVAGLAEAGNGALAIKLALSGAHKPVTDIIRLASKMEATFKALHKSALEAQTSRFKAITSQAYQPGFDSPAYRRLVQELGKCSQEERTLLLALGWLGRDYNTPQDYSFLLDHAADLIGNVDMNYLISQMPFVQMGIAKILAE